MPHGSSWIWHSAPVTGSPTCWLWTTTPKFTSVLFKFTLCIGSSLLVGSAYHKIAKAKAKRVNGVLGDSLWAFAIGRKDD